MKNILVITLSALAALMPLACQAQPTERSTSPQLYKALPPSEYLAIDRMVVLAQRRIAQARADLYAKRMAKARAHIAEARTFIHTLRYDLSSTVADDRIEIARTHLEYESPQQVSHDLRLIYPALEQISDYLPTDKAKRHVDQAGEYLKNGDRRAAEKELASAEGSLPQLEEERPLLSAEKYVAKAYSDLAEGHSRQADAALRVAEQRMALTASARQTPIRQAETTLKLANTYYSEGRIPEAGRYLEAASASLDKAAKTINTAAKQEVARLSSEIAGMKEELAKGGKEHQPIVQSFWERGKALAERSADYLIAGVQTAFGEDELIEAKLHTEYAKSYQLTASEPNQAYKEIDRAESCIGKAGKDRRMDTAARKKLDAVMKDLEYLKSHPEKTASARNRYNSAIARLKDLIQF